MRFSTELHEEATCVPNSNLTFISCFSLKDNSHSSACICSCHHTWKRLLMLPQISCVFPEVLYPHRDVHRAGVVEILAPLWYQKALNRCDQPVTGSAASLRPILVLEVLPYLGPRRLRSACLCPLVCMSTGTLSLHAVIMSIFIETQDASYKKNPLLAVGPEQHWALKGEINP